MAEIKYPPMLVTEAVELPKGPDWGYQVKLDGYRMIGRVALEGVTLQTRQGNDFTGRYPQVVEQLPAALGDREAIVDGEMVALGPDELHSFAALRNKRSPKIFYLFDLLELDGRPLIDKPLTWRLQQLTDIYRPAPSVQLSTLYFDRDSTLQKVRDLELEGVVAKRLSSPYEPGKRSRDWLKQILIRHPEGFGRK